MISSRDFIRRPSIPRFVWNSAIFVAAFVHLVHWNQVNFARFRIFIHLDSLCVLLMLDLYMYTGGNERDTLPIFSRPNSLFGLADIRASRRLHRQVVVDQISGSKACDKMVPGLKSMQCFSGFSL
jgi:hypothetical protein